MSTDLPLYEPDEEATYHLEILAQLTGISSSTILHYQENGLIRPRVASGEYDDETLHTLRRIEHLRTNCETNLSGLKLILDLLDQVEQLQLSLRARR